MNHLYPDDFADGYEDYSPDIDEVKCPRCNGTGINIEGWDCEYCDGYGYLEV